MQDFETMIETEKKNGCQSAINIFYLQNLVFVIFV